MTCASCVTRVERALARVPGVLSAEVNLATEHASIVRWRGQAGSAELIDGAARRRLRRRATRTVGPSAIAAPRVGDGARWRWRRCCRCRWCCRWPGAGSAAHWMLPGWLQLVLATPVQFWLGARFYRAGWKALRAGSGNMDLLVALGTSAAYRPQPDLLLSAPRRPCAPHLYFEVGGRRDHAGAARQVAGGARQAPDHRRDPRAAALRPEHARVRRDGVELELPLAQVRVGDLVVVRPGERVAGRRRGGRGREPRRRIADHRREPAGGQAARRPRHRRRDQRRRAAAACAPPRSAPRSTLARIVAAGRVGAGAQGADPARWSTA